MNMSEIEHIEARLPTGMRQVLSHLEKDRLIANANRERNACIAASFKALATRVTGLFARSHWNAADRTAASLGHRIG